ncbi:MAG: hypothetical protein LBK40_06195 [Spirochaetaceae bacterium]|jgi:hypothetical protein|nr:hypothetical protein [Spirochaetaceae bacterium]
MKKFTLIICFFVALAFIMTACSDKANLTSSPILWKDIKSGMSFDEVKAMYPTAELVKEADDTNKVEVLLFDGVIIQKENFLVQFVFEDKKIIGVSLYPKNEFKGNIADELFDNLEEELSQKYGSPVEENSDRINLLYDFKRFVWNTQGVIIELYYKRARFSTDISTLYVYYLAGTIEKEDNL